MFEGRKQSYTVASPKVVDDAYNYSSITYEDEKDPAMIYIIAQDRSLVYNNDLHLYEETYVGYTDDTRIDKNWLVDGKFIVISTLPHRGERVLYMKEFSDGK